MLLKGMIALDKVTVIINGNRTVDFDKSEPIVRLLVLEKPEDYKHSIAPNKVILEFDDYKITYELAGCPRCMNEVAKRS